MKTPKEYLEAQLLLEGLKIENDNRFVVVKTSHFDAEKNGNSQVPKVMAVKLDGNVNVYYSKNLSQELVEKLEKYNPEEIFTKTELVISILKEANEFKELGQYVAYVFPEIVKFDEQNTKVLDGNDEKIKSFDSSFYKAYPMLYVTINGEEIVACCASSRESEIAGEAWIFTPRQYRKQGFALKAVQLWANKMRKNNKIPFYSHEVSNIASQKLAEKLKLVKAFETVSYE